MTQRISVLDELRQATSAAISSKQLQIDAESTTGSDIDAQQFIDLVFEAAKEGLWEFDLAFHNRSDVYLSTIASKVKDRLFDVCVIVDLGGRKVSASWYPNK
jgi:hypothetical protein